jgi:hypothetical protein
LATCSNLPPEKNGPFARTEHPVYNRGCIVL